MKKYSEQTLDTEGYYFFIPQDRTPLRPFKPGGFVRVDEESIQEGWLKCPNYQGVYIGPIDMAAIDTVKAECPDPVVVDYSKKYLRSTATESGRLDSSKTNYSNVPKKAHS